MKEHNKDSVAVPVSVPLSEKASSSDDETRIGVETPKTSHDGNGFVQEEDILALQDLDPALNSKMRLVNNAIDEIGWTPYHWQLFVLNGFG